MMMQCHFTFCFSFAIEQEITSQSKNREEVCSINLIVCIIPITIGSVDYSNTVCINLKIISRSIAAVVVAYIISIPMTDSSTEVEQDRSREPTDAEKKTQKSPNKNDSASRHKLGSIALIIIFGCGAIALLFFVYRWWRYHSTHSYTNDAYVTNHIHPVNPRITGTVVDVLVTDNQTVTKGQPLVELDKSDYRVELQQQEANLAAAKKQAEVAKANIALAAKSARAQNTQAQGQIDTALANLADSEAAVAAAKADIPEAKAQLASIQADLQKTQADFERYQYLYEEGVSSAQQLDAARTAYEQDLASKKVAIEKIKQAQIQYEEARDRVSAVRGQLETRRGNLEAVQSTEEQIEVNRREYEAAIAEVDRAEALVENARLQLQYTDILAGASGKVGNKTVRVGQKVQPGQALMAIVPTEVWIVANFKETDLKRMRAGQPVKINIDTFDGQTFYGRVDSIAPASGAEFTLLPPSNATGNFTKIVQRVPVKILFDSESIEGYENVIVPGMSVEVGVVLEE